MYKLCWAAVSAPKARVFLYNYTNPGSIAHNVAHFDRIIEMLRLCKNHSKAINRRWCGLCSSTYMPARLLTNSVVQRGVRPFPFRNEFFDPNLSIMPQTRQTSPYNLSKRSRYTNNNKLKIIFHNLSKIEMEQQV
jgi:hypothetical protein